MRKRKWIRTRTSVRSQFGVVYADNDLEKVDGYEQRIPSVLVELRAWLLTERGLEQEGIFRVSPDQGEAERARESLNDKNLQHSGDVHIASYLIKDWFGKLPHPLLADLSTAAGDPLTQGGVGANEAGDVIKTIAEPCSLASLACLIGLYIISILLTCMWFWYGRSFIVRMVIRSMCEDDREDIREPYDIREPCYRICTQPSAWWY